VTRDTVLGLLAGVIAVALAAWNQYRRWWWYDNLAHLAAGVSLGSLIAREDSPIGQDLAIVACLTLAWELFEYGTRVHPWGRPDGLPRDAAIEDTVLDSLLVAIGAARAARWVKRT
jgi:hypothetical protein